MSDLIVPGIGLYAFVSLRFLFFRLQHSYSSRTGVDKLFIRRARFEKTVEAAVRTVIGKQGEDFFLEITCSDLVTTMYDNF